MGSIHSCVSSLKHIHFAIINHFLFNCNVSKMAAHSERKTQTANFRAVQNFAKSNWQETAQLHTFAQCNVWIFWEGHKIWKNLPHKIWRYWLASNFKWKIFFEFCGLLRMSEPKWELKREYAIGHAMPVKKWYHLIMLLH